ncbi:hypothetical protein GUITHDRAFT_147248 [Guillardia theta CCMP2712]|uniref:OTU domain-containing protein n=1 Tax=Guillardia theta (strain CCMP2712) TaxID=905079 RepID=L1IDR9_GUITC|nr:hypothetical protein GUITHDRAFT_147248 [Guillardia theta CCMP2712]EKX34406.1 hypothetical protein GUITHDRAFT_147248 [Guillardia theta CCMP2712]|eukprot:XP_005821386.1 hypothetical protein GUITHDRAFT_147248 [Guillardia theta CCMP2712]
MVEAARKNFESLMAEISSDEEAPVTKQEEKKEEQQSPPPPPSTETKKDEEKEEEEEEEEPAGFKYAASGKGKKGRQQKRKEAKAAMEKKRQEEAKESMKGWVDPREEEDKSIAKLLEPLGMRVRDIKPDGNCLYRALADQCREHRDSLPEQLGKEVEKWGGGDEDGYRSLRRVAANFLRSHQAEFEGFVEEADFSSYARQVEETAEWGGDIELMALARALHANIHVYSARMDEQTFSPFSPSSVHLRLSFHQHAYSLGAHYNSVVPA